MNFTRILKNTILKDLVETRKIVLIFGAGYDTGQDSLSTRGVDSVGRGIMIVDAETGELIRVKKPWWAFLAVEDEE